MNLKIITLLTDFGPRDHYVAAMKGVILGIAPEVRLIDITHMVPPQATRSGAYLLAATYRDFPEGTVHLAVVDPGVGTARRALLIRTEHHFFVGPDNGIFSLVLEKEKDWRAWSIENPRYRRDSISRTFHGRDIFAPAAAHLAGGIPPESFGPACSPLISPWSSALRKEDGLHGEIIHIDHFGNIITNLKEEDLDAFALRSRLLVNIAGHILDTISDTYGEHAPGTLLALIGSTNRLEISVNLGDAAKTLGVRPGDTVSVHLPKQPGS